MTFEEKLEQIKRAKMEGLIKSEEAEKLTIEAIRKGSDQTAITQRATEAEPPRSKPQRADHEQPRHTPRAPGVPVNKIVIGLLLIAIISFAYIAYESVSALFRIEQEKKQLNIELADLRSEKYLLESSLRTEESKVRNLQRLNLSRPTEQELTDFLGKDRTYTTYWNKDIYVCLQFAREVKNHARVAGINMSFVAVNYKASLYSSAWHACNSVILRNGVVVYVEPQKAHLFNSLQALLDALEGERVTILNQGEVW